MEHNFNISMRKKGSPHLVQIRPDTDPHFSEVKLIKVASGEVRAKHFILTSDVPQWRGMYERDGFREVKQGVRHD